MINVMKYIKYASIEFSKRLVNFSQHEYVFYLLYFLHRLCLYMIYSFFLTYIHYIIQLIYLFTFVNMLFIFSLK